MTRLHIADRANRSPFSVLAVTVVVACLPAIALAEGHGAVEDTEAVIVTGRILRGSGPGSSFVVDGRELDSLRPLSLNVALRLSPGVQVIDEDIFGLKLNVSVRGLTPRRSGRTLLLEDGMPIQPAPYSEPSAHYSPALERIERIEILKGSGEILEGPQSLGGMINFVTRPIPRSQIVNSTLAIGTRDFASAHVSAGTGGDRGGFVVDAVAKHSAGIRDGHRTAFAEFAFKGQLDLSTLQSLTLRVTRQVEQSSLTEAGLDAGRYGANPYANPFRSDRFELQRTAIQLVHEQRWSQSLRTRGQVYAASTFRASYRQTDTSTDSMIANPATGCVGSARFEYESWAPQCGNKMRPRDFYFQGLEARALLDGALWGTDHAAVIGLRLHHEEVDRRRYNGLFPDARESTTGTVLRDHNEITTDALSLFALDTATRGAVSLSAGLRVEQISTRNTSVVANFAARGQSVSKREAVVLPGVGLAWQVGAGSTLFAGVHRGFAPPRPDRDVDPLAPTNQVRSEKSVNSELGVRSSPRRGVTVEGTVFAVNFSELVVAGPLLGLPSGTLFNAGKALHAGAELYTRVDLGEVMGWSDRPWVSLSLTHLATAEFRSDIGEGVAGVRGKRIPYAPRLMAEVGVGVETEWGLGVRLGLTHVGEQFADAANTVAPSADGTIGLIPSHTTSSLALNWRPKGRDWSLFLSGQNLGDSRYFSTRTDGLFAGPRRQFHAGFKSSW